MVRRHADSMHKTNESCIRGRPLINPVASSLANARIAASRVAAYPWVGVRPSWWGKINVHIHGDPTGAALALKMRPIGSPSASTSKSSLFHSPDGREAEARA
jgi:hypothetical protein